MSNSDYGSWKLADLKGELRKRKAKLSGQKADLVKRLEFYDKNLGRQSEETLADDRSYAVIKPHKSKYRDINADSKLPFVSQEAVRNYLDRYGVKISNKIRQLYEDKFLVYLRYTEEGSSYFVLACCAAEMKKHVRYAVDVRLNQDGIVMESQCECAVGLAPHAHCKHVQCTLLSLASFSSTGQVLTMETSTQLLQTFHQCKRFKGSPIKAHKLKLRKAGQRKDLHKLSDFDPRPQELVKVSTYNSYVQNLAVNFQASTISCKHVRQPLPMPILQTAVPANLYGVASDHDYLELHPEYSFLNSVKLQNISQADVNDIEIKTKGQSSNKLWFEERSMRITSSNFGRICKLGDRGHRQRLAALLVNPKSFTSDSVRHGQMYEPVALKLYEKLYDLNTQPCGVFVSTLTPYLASSPDALVKGNDDLVVEVKCPYVSKNKAITPQTVPYLCIQNGALTLDRKHDYFYQVQGQLYCTAQKLCHFVVYTFQGIEVVCIERDKKFIDEMVKQLSEFYNNHFRSELLNYHFYHRMDAVNLYS